MKEKKYSASIKHCETKIRYRGRRGRGWSIGQRLESDITPENATRRNPEAREFPLPRVSKSLPPSTPKATAGSSSRPQFFILGNPAPDLKMSKLPTTEAILGKFLLELAGKADKGSAAEAASSVRQEMKIVWKHHFGIRLIEGKELGNEEAENENLKIIKMDKHIEDQIKQLWKEWSKLEYDSRRPGRASSKR